MITFAYSRIFQRNSQNLFSLNDISGLSVSILIKIKMTHIGYMIYWSLMTMQTKSVGKKIGNYSDLHSSLDFDEFSANLKSNLFWHKSISWFGQQFVEFVIWIFTEITNYKESDALLSPGEVGFEIAETYSSMMRTANVYQILVYMFCVPYIFYGKVKGTSKFRTVSE